MAVNETIGQLGKDLNQNAVEFNGKCEDGQLEIGEHPAENSRGATETASCASTLESGEQSNAVVSNGNEEREVNGDDHASPLQTEDVNGTNAVTSADDDTDEFFPRGSQEDSGDVVMNGSEEASAEIYVSSDTTPTLPEQTDSDGVPSSDAVADDFCTDEFFPRGSQKDSGDVVMNGSEEASAEIYVSSDTTPTLPEQTDSDGVPSSDAVADDFSELRVRKESLQRLCDVLMEERDQATSTLKEKDAEVLRLRKFIVESEAEKKSLKNRLVEVLDRSVLAEKEVISVQEENATLQAEITRLRKRVEQLEAENSDLKNQLQQASVTNGENKTPPESENVTLSHADELQEKPASDVISNVEDKSQEILNVATEESEVVDEPKRADETKDHESGSSTEEVVRRRERAAKRAAPNFYRHSFAGSLPRPFQSYELPRQGSVSREDGARNERSGSFHSDTSGESESSESGSHSGIPSFMRRSDKPTFLKSGYSPVQFNFQPLPESITHRRESWDATRHTRPRGGSLNRARESSESESSGIGSLSRGQNGDELYSAPDHLDGGQGKSAEDVESEKCGVTVQVSSLPSTDSQSNTENSQNSKDLISATVISVDECPSNVSLQNEEKLDSNYQSQDQVHPEEDEKRESVSELVNIWNKRTTDVIDV